MNQLYPTMTTAELRDNPSAIYKKVIHHPVVVFSRATPKIVCVHPDEWNKLAQLIEDQEDIIAALKAELALAKGEEQATEITDIDAFRAEMMRHGKRVSA
jgi:PHD/YefM family antitoxin component YafN of YafNO toxin-antitoxin module